MPSELYSAIGSDKNVSTNQDPKEAAMNRMKEMGISIPEGMENNPQALIQHVMSSGRVPNNRLSMAQQVMQRLFGRR
jgi:RIO-like serine/threonine protein kinase